MLVWITRMIELEYLFLHFSGFLEEKGLRFQLLVESNIGPLSAKIQWANRIRVGN